MGLSQRGISPGQGKEPIVDIPSIWRGPDKPHDLGFPLGPARQQRHSKSPPCARLRDQQGDRLPVSTSCPAALRSPLDLLLCVRFDRLKSRSSMTGPDAFRPRDTGFYFRRICTEPIQQPSREVFLRAASEPFAPRLSVHAGDVVRFRTLTAQSQVDANAVTARLHSIGA